MTKLKALIVTLVVGSSSAAMAAPKLVASADATLILRNRAPREVYRPIYHPTYERPVYNRFSLSGSYSSAYGPVQLFHRGDIVTGTFTSGGGGTIEGRIVGNQIVFRWKNTAERGRGVWFVSNPNRIDGTWGNNASDADGGAWNLKRV